MLGMFNLLPLLKGWEYKTHTLARTAVVRGATPIQLSVREQGWLLSVGLLSTDCYGTLNINWQGAELETLEGSFFAEGGLALGAVVQDPAGWVQRYFRPNPASTAGIFMGVLSSGGYQGSAWPYFPTVIMNISLPTTSTQASAYIRATAASIAITQPKLFLQSLRSILGIKGKIDPALLVIGPAEFLEYIKR